jgi:hypothetical protein
MVITVTVLAAAALADIDAIIDLAAITVAALSITSMVVIEVAPLGVIVITVRKAGTTAKGAANNTMVMPPSPS